MFWEFNNILNTKQSRFELAYKEKLENYVVALLIFF